MSIVGQSVCYLLDNPLKGQNVLKIEVEIMGQNKGFVDSVSSNNQRYIDSRYCLVVPNLHIISLSHWYCLIHRLHKVVWLYCRMVVVSCLGIVSTLWSVC